MDSTDPKIIVVSSADTYRRLARELPSPSDVVLEIGCSTGEATKRLAASGARVIAVDSSYEFTKRLGSELAGQSNVTVAFADGRHIDALRDLVENPTMILVDIGGNASLDAVALQLRLCLRAFRPRLMLVRSFELAALASLIGNVEAPETSPLQPTGGGGTGTEPIAPLLDLSSSAIVSARLFAVRQLRKCQDPRARQRLKELLADPNSRVRKSAEWACGGTGSPAAE